MTRRLICLLILAAIALASCGPERTTRPSTGPSSRPGRAGEPSALDPQFYRPVATYSSRVAAEVQPRAAIPYDNMTLPLVSPDGRFIATQVGLTLPWETILAERGGVVPQTSRVEIYELPLIGNDPPRLVAAVREAAVLGRACDADGFLIEAPREDGSRWIGLADWTSGTVTWLVSDRFINAFASLGPDGRLAWSRRAADGDAWELVVDRGEAQWTLPAQDGDWLMPIFSGVGDGLFALILRDGALDLVHMVATDPDSVRRTIRRVPVATSGATIDTAYQAINAHQIPPAGVAPSVEQLVYYHPVHYQAAAWRPPAPPVLLGERTITAVTDSADPRYLLVATNQRLLHRNFAAADDSFELLVGMRVPRVTTAPDRPFLLLYPADGEIGLMIMRLVPLSELPEP